MDESFEHPKNTLHVAEPTAGAVLTDQKGSAHMNEGVHKPDERGDNVSEADSDGANIHVDNPDERSTANVETIQYIHQRSKAIDKKLADHKAKIEKQLQDIDRLLQAGLNGLELRIHETAGRAFEQTVDRLAAIEQSASHSSAPAATPPPAPPSATTPTLVPPTTPAPSAAPLPRQTSMPNISQISITVDITCEPIYGASSFHKVIRLPLLVWQDIL